MKVVVIGTGTMGKGLVQLFAQTNMVEKIYWKGTSIEKTQQGLEIINKTWKKMLRKKQIGDKDIDLFHTKIISCKEYQDLHASIDLFIEAIPEEIDKKKSIISQIPEEFSQSIIASNTSSLSITELASTAQNPEKVIGLHFFNPAPIMNLTEIVAGLQTSQETVDWVYKFAQALGKKPVIVNEAPGFIVNRMLIPMINEAIGILAEGVATAEEIDTAMRYGANHPMGPLALADFIGNDINLSIMETLHHETGDPKYRAHPLLRKMVRANKLGRKTGVGFFKY